MRKLSSFLGANDAPQWTPTSVTHLQNLTNMVTKIHGKNRENPFKAMYTLDINSSQAYNGNFLREKSPALTHARACCSGFYLPAYKRMMSTSEMMRLQGFPLTVRRHTMTPRQFDMCLGNAMTMPMLARLARTVMGAAGIIDVDHVADPVAY